MLVHLAATAAFGCGQTTHVTLTLWAAERLPPGELADLVQDPEVHAALVSGAMFPDGGYSPIVDHPYGEVAHWEPFQQAWADTLPPPPWSGDDRQRVAFLLGMVSHGIADQGYDAAYLKRADLKDADAPRADSADTETDVAFAAEVGALPNEDHWVPYDELVPVFASVGVEVDADTMQLGMTSLDLAILYVASAAALPERVELAHTNWPWATSHLLDPTVPGSPEVLVDLIGRDWQGWWDRLHGDAASVPAVLAVWPAPGAEVAESGEDALVSVVFSRALSEASIEAPGVVTVATADGDAVEAEAWMYYGEGSNVLDLMPVEAWEADADHAVSFAAGIETFEGVALTPPEVGFSTAPPPASSPTAEEAGGCGCAASGLPSGAPSGAVGLAWLPLALLRRRRR